MRGEAVSRGLSFIFKNYQKIVIVKGVRGSVKGGGKTRIEDCWEVKGGMFDYGRSGQGRKVK